MVIFFILKARLLLLEAVKTDRRLKLGSKVLYFVCAPGIHIYICAIFMLLLLMVTSIVQLVINLATGDRLALLPVLIIMLPH